MPWIQVSQRAIDLLAIDSLLNGKQMSTEQVKDSHVDGQKSIWVDAEVVDMLRNRRRTGETMSDVIVRIFDKEDQ